MLLARVADPQSMVGKTRRRMVRAAVAALVVLFALGVAGAASAAPPPGMPQKGRIMLGVGGSLSTPTQFQRLTHARHSIHMISLGWGQTVDWGGSMQRYLDAAQAGNYRMMIHMATGRKGTKVEAISPGAIGAGNGDSYLLSMSRQFNDSNQYLYVRPMGEMNGHWNNWCAFNANGTRRNAAHSTAAYRRAFRRMAIIMRGGTMDEIDQRLHAAGLNALSVRQADITPSGRVAMVWNPQGEGSPNVRGNQPKDYFPGKGYVDYVANDLYSINHRANWRAQDKLWKAYRAYPFMMAEWGNWGNDDPGFIKQMFTWATKHRNTVALIYFNGTSSSTFKLSNKSRSLGTYRSWAGRQRFRCDQCGTFTTPA